MSLEWYKESFGKDYLLVYPHRNRAMANDEVERLIDWLQLTEKDQILDLCCGTGRHSISLAKRNFNVLGLDLSWELLNIATKMSQSEMLPIHFIHGDMRQLPFVDQSYDVVLNLFTSFGYFHEDQQNFQVLLEIARVLKSEGRFFIDFLNKEAIVSHLIPESERQEKGMIIKENRRIEGDYVCKNIRIVDGNEERRYEERVKMYTYHQLLSMIEEAGMTVNATYGSYQGEPYTKESERMIIIGTVYK
ncbi:class I SAM-dependent methyltransferase [Thermoflavimicrobium daqui]|uniref:Class I SAM-dependent methyltransferase n=1 Tax=Thermoflavimicrobium daqui TaxID=2137476 RepID=A0A364K9N0_9BACL|nr:class I SAM-dependent methyltransferase [Thermoflavimicrobium daqui]RAL27001.1 class I SAM-dependent methyltransferase [Thermoflavimicrobium daqui]